MPMLKHVSFLTAVDSSPHSVSISRPSLLPDKELVSVGVAAVGATPFYRAGEMRPHEIRLDFVVHCTELE